MTRWVPRCRWMEDSASVRASAASRKRFRPISSSIRWQATSIGGESRVSANRSAASASSLRRRRSSAWALYSHPQASVAAGVASAASVKPRVASTVLPLGGGSVARRLGRLREALGAEIPVELYLAMVATVRHPRMLG